jgi:hypothetical protein
VNTPDFKHAKLFTKTLAFVLSALVLIAVMIARTARADWNIDFSRRAHANREADLQATKSATEDTNPDQNSDQNSDRSPASVGMADHAGEAPPAKKGLFDTIFDSGEPVQDIVILHTERGFTPSTVRVRKNGRYRISVVNVNEKEKNVSFILDGFSEHHATYYGKVKTFMLEPKKEGAYSFQSPETSAEGKLIVFNPQISMRAPASDSGDGK